MPTIRTRILEYLLEHPDGAGDDELTSALHLKNRAQANQRSRQLAQQGFISRRSVDGKYRNFVADPRKAKELLGQECSTVVAEQPWFWEGNVQSVVVEFLQRKEYVIVRQANTRTRETGRDIEATRNDERLWVTVKGYPKGTAKTNPSTQAPHWFSNALFDILEWRGQDSDAHLAMALPDFPRYRNLSQKVAWLQPIARFAIMWVREDGSLIVTGADI
jgi:hypothetical protein